MTTKAQQLMIDDGLPAAVIIDQKERLVAWADKPVTQYTWNTHNHNQPKEKKMIREFLTMDVQQLKAAYDKMATEATVLGVTVPGFKKNKTKEIGIKQCEALYKSICEAKGETYDPLDYESLPAEPDHKNDVDISKTKIKPKKEATTKSLPPTHPAIRGASKTVKDANAAKRKAEKKPTKKQSAPVPKLVKASEDEHPICVATGIRTNSLLGRIILFLGSDSRLGKMVAEKLIIKHLYNDERKTNRIEVLGKQMKKDKYDLRKDIKDGVTSYGLYAKK